MEAESFVLAGGRSARMGRDKALTPIRGRPLVVIALEKLRRLPLLTGASRIAGNRPDLAIYAPIVEDIHPACGPLSGIEAALSATRQPLNVFLPVDLPLLPEKFLEWMLLRASVTGALITYPRMSGRPQPLCAVYHRDLLAPIARALDAGERKVIRVIAAAAYELAGPDPQAIDIFDVKLLATTYPELGLCSSLPVHRWFQNCNAPEDLATLDACEKEE